MSDMNNQNNKKNNDPDIKPPGWKRYLPFLIMLAFILAIWFIPMASDFTGRTTVPYSVFINQLDDRNLSQVVIQGDEITGRFVSEVNVTLDEQEKQVAAFRTWAPAEVSESVTDRLIDENIQVQTLPPETDSFWTVVLNFLPFLLIIWLFMRMSGGLGGKQGGLFNVGQNKAKRYKPTHEDVTFNEVAGIESAKEELMEVVDFLKNPARYVELGAKTPKGVLLVGAPGTGKTLLARATASEAGVPFFSISGSDFIEMFVGVGASRVRNLFKEARKNSPSIIFIDELDSIGRKRGAGLGGGHDEREQTLNQLLNEIDGFEKNTKTIILAATNRPDVLDPALQRPGRFDRRITVNLPTRKDRVHILEIHSRKKPLADEVNLDGVASNTPGFSGADLENLVNEAALIAARSKQKTITTRCFHEARDKITLGLERKSLVMSKREKGIVAFHETGHAIAALCVKSTEPLHKVTIIPREFSMGVTQQLPEEDRYLYEKEYIESRMIVMMGGRAAENIMLQTQTSGAENDLKEAFKLAKKMILDWGMSDAFKNVAFGSQTHNVFLGENISKQKDYSEDTGKQLDRDIAELLRKSYQEAERILTENKKALEAIANELKEKEELSGERVKAILDANAGGK